MEMILWSYLLITIVLTALMFWVRPQRRRGAFRYPRRALYLEVWEIAAVPGGSKTYFRHAIFFDGPPDHRFALAPNKTMFWNVFTNKLYYKTGAPGMDNGQWIAVNDGEKPRWAQ